MVVVNERYDRNENDSLVKSNENSPVKVKLV